MARLRITPWKKHSELTDVRDQLYPVPPYHGEGRRAEACSLVSVWKVRGNLPHAVEATALLTDAILHDDPDQNSLFSIRAAYSLAFCRFVTGLVDSKLHDRRQTMYQKAMSLGVPASFVELRHEATHRDLPSLIVLRNAAQRSLKWLWDFYWVHIEDDKSLSESLVNNELFDGAIATEINTTLKPVARDIVRPMVERRKNLSTSMSATGKGRKLLEKKDDFSRLAEINKFCCHNRTGIRALAQVLLEQETNMLPSTLEEDADEVQPRFSDWDDFLKEVCRHQPLFLTTLVEEMVAVLVGADGQSSPNKEQNYTAIDGSDIRYEESLFSWMEHILLSETLATTRNRYLILSYVEATCDGPDAPATYWVRRLRSLLAQMPAEDATAGFTRPIMGANRDGNGIEDPMEIDTKESTDSNCDEAALRGFGWDKAHRVKFRPIGA